MICLYLKQFRYFAEVSFPLFPLDGSYHNDIVCVQAK